MDFATAQITFIFCLIVISHDIMRWFAGSVLLILLSQVSVTNLLTVTVTTLNLLTLTVTTLVIRE